MQAERAARARGVAAEPGDGGHARDQHPDALLRNAQRPLLLALRGQRHLQVSPRPLTHYASDLGWRWSHFVGLGVHIPGSVRVHIPEFVLNLKIAISTRCELRNGTNRCPG